MASEKQIAANRANAALSTGPRTPEGKAQSSKNGLRHAALARCVLLRNESVERFNNFVAGYYAEYQPSTSTENTLVEIMATARWRSMRMSNIDAANLDIELERQLGNPASDALDNATLTGMAYRESADTSRTLDLINRTEARLQRQFDSALDRLNRLQTRRGKHRQNMDSIVPPPASSRTNPISNEENQPLNDTFEGA